MITKRTVKGLVTMAFCICIMAIGMGNKGGCQTIPIFIPAPAPFYTPYQPAPYYPPFHPMPYHHPYRR